MARGKTTLPPQQGGYPYGQGTWPQPPFSDQKHPLPNPTQQWKSPVKQWIHELYEEKIGKIPVKKHRGTQSFKRIKYNENSPVPLHAYAEESALMKNRDNSPHETMTDWQEYVDGLWDDSPPSG